MTSIVASDSSKVNEQKRELLPGPDAKSNTLSPNGLSTGSSAPLSAFPIDLLPPPLVRLLLGQFLRLRDLTLCACAKFKV